MKSHYLIESSFAKTPTLIAFFLKKNCCKGYFDVWCLRMVPLCDQRPKGNQLDPLCTGETQPVWLSLFFVYSLLPLSVSATSASLVPCCFVKMPGGFLPASGILHLPITLPGTSSHWKSSGLTFHFLQALNLKASSQRGLFWHAHLKCPPRTHILHPPFLYVRILLITMHFAHLFFVSPWQSLLSV